MAPVTNPELVTVLRRWTSAASDADHSSQQSQTFRRAAASLAAHPTAVTSAEQALQVKFVGAKLSALLGQWLNFQQELRHEPLRTVATLHHDEEGKWWCVALCGTSAWRSWGRRTDAGNRPGFDGWEILGSATDALAWAVEKAKKQLAKGYTHAPGSDDAYASASAEVPQRARPRAAARKRAPAASGSAGDAACSSTTGAASAAPRASGEEQASELGRVAEPPAGEPPTDATESGHVRAGRAHRSYLPKLLDVHGEVGAPAAVLVALHRAADASALSAPEVVQLAQPLCPTVALETVAQRGAGGRGRGGGRGGRSGRALQYGAMSGLLAKLLKYGLVACEAGGRAKRYRLTAEAGPSAAPSQPSGRELGQKLSAQLERHCSDGRAVDAAVARSLTQPDAPAAVEAEDGSATDVDTDVSLAEEAASELGPDGVAEEKSLAARMSQRATHSPQSSPRRGRRVATPSSLPPKRSRLERGDGAEAGSADALASEAREAAAAASDGLALSLSHELVMVVDCHEKLSRSMRADVVSAMLAHHVAPLGVSVATKQLPVGDFLVVALPKGAVAEARERASGAGSGGGRGRGGRRAGPDAGRDPSASGVLELADSAWAAALCLDTVVERKAVSDFLTTTRDGRHYHSQKVRLRGCGLARAVYLVEGAVERWGHVGERQKMKLELARIEMVDNLLVHRSASTSGTMAFLTAAAARLVHAASTSSAAQLRAVGALCTYAEFCARASPARLRSDEFGAMLLSLDGMTAPKIECLLARYPTARAVGEALEAHRAECRAAERGAEEGWLFEQLLEPGHSRKALSQRLSAFLSAWDYDDEQGAAGAAGPGAARRAWPRPD